jgi:hypothetical protein
VKIEAVLFDLGKVLIDFNFETGVQALHACCSISRDQFEDVLWDERWIQRYERGEISIREFHEYLCEAADWNMAFPDFFRTWRPCSCPACLYLKSCGARSGITPDPGFNTNEAHIGSSGKITASSITLITRCFLTKSAR